MIKGIWTLLTERTDFFAGLLLEHLEISLLAIVIATLVGGLAGILISEFQRTAKPALAVINFLYTIPSISMLGFLIPFSGVGNATAVIALTVYALLPMVRNTHTGMVNVDPAILEAAKGMGSTRMQILFKIKIPMIMPSVTICTFLTLTNGFKMFDQNLSLTGGDPGKQSQLLALNIYDTFYARSGPQWKGIGQAKAVVFFILVVAIALIQLKATSSKEVQQ